MKNVISIVLGGGKGTRLQPLTNKRAKPAVPFGGKYRLVDIPISNSIHANFKQIYVLTQFNSASLHMHLSHTYVFDSFSKGFVEILAAEQNKHGSQWFNGTADAVRKTLSHYERLKPSHYLILSGDQLYRIDLKKFVKEHIANNADVSIAATPVNKEDASGFGIMQIDKNGTIQSFCEKPTPDMDISYLKIPAQRYPENYDKGDKDYLASMGIYCFSAEVMNWALNNLNCRERPNEDISINDPAIDFGYDIIPQLLNTHKLHSYVYTGFWEDIGTIRSYYDTSLGLTHNNPPFNFYDENIPIFTHKRYLPSTKINECELNQAIVADGCIIKENVKLSRSIIGVRSVIMSNVFIEGVIMMGSDYYESEAEQQNNIKIQRPNQGIGANTIIKRCIIDKNARIGANCSIGFKDSYSDGEYNNGLYYIRDGIIVIQKSGIIPDNTII